jgi:aspartate 1-decarboxylase
LLHPERGRRAHLPTRRPVIICNSVHVDERQITELTPRIPAFDRNDHVVDRLIYDVRLDEDGRYRFAIVDEHGSRQSILLRATAPV